MGQDNIYLRDNRGYVVPSIVFGTSSLGQWEPMRWAHRQKKAFRLLDDIYEAGCRAIDLARSYQLGASEALVGEWLKVNGVRNTVFLTTKIGHPTPILRPFRLNRTQLDTDLQASLSALKVDQVDLLMLHRDHPRANLYEISAYFTEVLHQGRAKSVGVSNWSYPRIKALQALMGKEMLLSSSPQYSLVSWKHPIWDGCYSISGRKHRYERNVYAHQKLKTFAYCPLGRGFLTQTPQNLSWFITRATPFGEQDNQQRRQRAQELAREKAVHPVQIALAYLINQPFPVFPVVSVSSKAHMQMNLEACELLLSPDELHWLDYGETIDSMAAVA